jgi:transcriptional regulator GlxA family with amidase domain
MTVPAMSRDDDAAALAWIKIQAAKGATIIGVCAGAKVVAEAGLLDGRRGTTHWYYAKELRQKHPRMQYVVDPVAALDEALGRIGARYGTRTANFVAMQLEYPTIDPAPAHSRR